jgi:hypothetical protein
LTPGGRRFAPIVSERFYDKQRHLVRVVSRIDDKVEADYTTTAVEDEFSTFPGLLDQADFYRKALASGRAKLVGKGEWQGHTVYWLELQKGGGFILRVGVDRDTYRPVVFQALNPDRTSSGFQLAVLGFEYVSPGQASLDPRAPILATGKVIGPDCRPLQARVEASLSSEPELGEERVTVGQAVARSAPDGTFTLRANPENPPFREARLRQSILNLDLSAIAGKKAPAYIGFFGFTRTARDGRWWDSETKKPASAAPITLRMLAKSAPGRICKR